MSQLLKLSLEVLLCPRPERAVHDVKASGGVVHGVGLGDAWEWWSGFLGQ